MSREAGQPGAGEQPAAEAASASPSSSEPSPASPASPAAPPPLAPLAAPAPAPPSNYLRFLLTVGRLKRLRRTGWVREGVPEPESVAEHMYRLAMACLALPAAAEPAVDRMHCMRLALVHDLAEALCGDITPHCGVSAAEKHVREGAALAEIAATVPDPAVRAEILALFAEYEAGATHEARLVKDLDKLEMLLQAWEYEGREAGRDLQPFFDGTAGKLRTEFGREVDGEIRRLRAAGAAPEWPPGAAKEPASQR